MARYKQSEANRIISWFKNEDIAAVNLVYEMVREVVKDRQGLAKVPRKVRKSTSTQGAAPTTGLTAD